MNVVNVLIFCLNKEIKNLLELFFNRKKCSKINREYYIYEFPATDSTIDFEKFNCVVVLDYLEPKYHSSASKYVGVHTLKYIEASPYRGDLIVSLAGVNTRYWESYSPIELDNRFNPVIERHVDYEKFRSLSFERVFFIPDYCSNVIPDILDIIYKISGVTA